MDVRSSLREKMEAARRRADEIGEYIGMVSRLYEMRASSSPQVFIEVPPEKYFANWRGLSSIGWFLIAVDLKSLNLVSLRVKEVRRRDALSEIRDISRTSPSEAEREVEGIITSTVIVAEPLLSLDEERDLVTTANFAIEPQSPVVLPRPRYLIRTLGLHEDGVFVGALTVGDEVVGFGDEFAILRLPLNALYQHTFVVGTTGSGKSTFMKNLIYSIIAEQPNSRVLVLDVTGDYPQIALKGISLDQGNEREVSEKITRNAFPTGVSPPRKMRILLPVTNGLLDMVSEDLQLQGPPDLLQLARWYFENSVSKVAGKFLDEPIQILKVVDRTDPKRVEAEVEALAGDHEFSIGIVPMAYRFSEIREKVGDLSPHFSTQARFHVVRLLKHLGLLERRTLEEVLRRLRTCNVQDLERQTHIHKNTIDNIIRNLNMLGDIGIFDIELGGGYYLKEPDYFALMEPGVPVVADLSMITGRTEVEERGRSLVSMRILDMVFEGRRREALERADIDPVFIFIDEAHRFFPASAISSEDKEALNLVAQKITDIARLGRARKMGIVFSTHSPRDVHSIILQLTNNKVIFRVDPVVVRDLAIPSELQDQVTRFSDRVALVKSHMLRIGYATVKIPMPLLGHFDRSAL